jgi:hypothetical protein
MSGVTTAHRACSSTASSCPSSGRRTAASACARPPASTISLPARCTAIRVQERQTPLTALLNQVDRRRVLLARQQRRPSRGHPARSRTSCPASRPGSPLPRVRVEPRRAHTVALRLRVVSAVVQTCHASIASAALARVLEIAHRRRRERAAAGPRDPSCDCSTFARSVVSCRAPAAHQPHWPDAADSRCCREIAERSAPSRSPTAGRSRRRPPVAAPALIESATFDRPARSWPISVFDRPAPAAAPRDRRSAPTCGRAAIDRAITSPAPHPSRPEPPTPRTCPRPCAAACASASRSGPNRTQRLERRLRSELRRSSWPSMPSAGPDDPPGRVDDDLAPCTTTICVCPPVASTSSFARHPRARRRPARARGLVVASARRCPARTACSRAAPASAASCGPATTGRRTGCSRPAAPTSTPACRARAAHRPGSAGPACRTECWRTADPRRADRSSCCDPPRAAPATAELSAVKRL